MISEAQTTGRINSEFPAAASSPSYQQACLWSLVLCAENLPHNIQRHKQGWLIVVPEEIIERARWILASFEKENENWPPPKEKAVGFGLFHDRHPPTVLIMGIMLIFFSLTGPWAEHSSWFTNGALSGEQVLGHGQWWRVITALTLHANPVHVLSNAIIGGVVVHFLCKILGSGLGWLLVILAGALGNSINIIFQGHDHNAVGFSTAVFAAIGILSGLEMKRHQGFKGLLLPFGAGISLLAMLGSEGQHTDLGAHLWGLATGGVTGWLVAVNPPLLRWGLSYKIQLALFVLSCLLVTGSWWLAGIS
jgi:membrane associated rhomboid family serine protease